MTQIMWLDNLAPNIREEFLFLPKTTQGRDAIKEADIRPIAKTLDWTKQRQMWNRLRKSTIGLQGKTNSSKFSATVGSQLDAAGLASEASAASFSP